EFTGSERGCGEEDDDGRKHKAGSSVLGRDRSAFYMLSFDRVSIDDVDVDVGSPHRRPARRIAARRQNCVSLSSVIRWPLARSRLISISFSPASRPAAWSGFGRPRTTTVVRADGMPCTIAPARRAALIASLRVLLRMPVKARWTPLSVRIAPIESAAGGLVSAAIISFALS